MQQRDPYLYIATGVKGVGKSHRTRQELEAMARGNGSSPAQKIIIFDTNDEYVANEHFSYEVPSIDFDITAPNEKIAAKHLLALTRPGMYRILPYKKNGDPMVAQEKAKTAEILLKYVRNGCVVLEDLNNYMLGAKTIDMIGAITTNRHRDQDIIIHLQSACVLDPRLWQNTNIVRLHHQPDPLKRIRGKITNYELFEIAKVIVDTQYFKGNKRFFVYIHNIGNKITGCSEKLFIEGCHTYLQKNIGEIRNLEFEVDLASGKKKHSRASAIKEWVNSKMHYIAA